MKYYVKRTIVIVLGFIFLILGIVGLALPFLQGFLFIAIGLLLLSAVSPTLRHYVESHTRRWPKLHEVVMRVDGWFKKIIGEV
jgi:uncharacterized membrane protein YbaN (DUF454 family)